MKTRKILTLLLLSVVFPISMMAQETIIHADSVHLLNKDQIKLLKYTKRLAKQNKHTFELPIEVNHLLNDDTSKKYPKTILQWNDAYFINRKDYKATIIVPTLAQIDTCIVESYLSVILDKENNYHRIIYSTFMVPNGKETEYICLKSNIFGTLLSTVVFDNNKTIAEIDAKGYPWGVTDSPIENNFDMERMRRDEKYCYLKVRGINYYKYSSVLKHDGNRFTDTKGRVHFY